MPLQKLIGPEPPAAKKAGRLERMATFEPEPHRAAPEARGPDRLQRMAVFGPEPEVLVVPTLVAPAKPVEPEPIPEPEPVPEPVRERINKLASMALSEPAPVPPPVPRPDQLAKMAVYEAMLEKDPDPVADEPVTVATEKRKKWSFEFERNPNGTIRRINATEVED